VTRKNSAIKINEIYERRTSTAPSNNNHNHNNMHRPTQQMMMGGNNSNNKRQSFAGSVSTMRAIQTAIMMADRAASWRATTPDKKTNSIRSIVHGNNNHNDHEVDDDDDDDDQMIVGRVPFSKSISRQFSSPNNINISNNNNNNNNNMSPTGARKTRFTFDDPFSPTDNNNNNNNHSNPTSRPSTSPLPGMKSSSNNNNNEELKIRRPMRRQSSGLFKPYIEATENILQDVIAKTPAALGISASDGQLFNNNNNNSNNNLPISPKLVGNNRSSFVVNTAMTSKV
jgi:hypothetical protein